MCSTGQIFCRMTHKQLETRNLGRILRIPGVAMDTLQCEGRAQNHFHYLKVMYRKIKIDY